MDDVVNHHLGQSLELDGERSVTFRDRGHAYTYTFSRIGASDWLRYFDGVAITSRRDGKNGVLETMDLESAGVDLVESKVIKVEGYDGDFMQDAEVERVSALRPRPRGGAAAAGRQHFAGR
jgi:hypothetical protein